MDIVQAVKELTPVLAKRLNRTEPQVADLARAYAAAVLEQSVAVVTGAEGSSLSGAQRRNALVERLVAALGRVPSDAELAALLRVKETLARSSIAQVLAESDRAREVVVASLFGRATKKGEQGGSGAIPGGTVWKMNSRTDLAFAQRELERLGIKYATVNSKDGNYELVTDPAWTP